MFSIDDRVLTGNWTINVQAAPDNQLWKHDTDNHQLVNKENNDVKLDVDPSWALPPTGTGTIMKDQSTTPKTVYGLNDDDVTTNPIVVEEDLKASDGQRWKLDNNMKLENKDKVLKSFDLWIFEPKDDDSICIENTSK